DRDRGVMLNFVNNSSVEGNIVRGGTEKCLFMYNANRNFVTGNRFEGCSIGIHFTAGSANNSVWANAFIHNRTQVKYVGSTVHEWSHDGVGNYWSDYATYDVNGDGVGDQPYRPNDAIDQIVWTQPAARLLLGSPAVQLVRWAQSAFPALLPGGVVDSAPLMRPPARYDITPSDGRSP
ncbi:MAG TPA: NosD domain-containing protein, partial [Parvularculaceae bacterium]|nr:NosD domain-containing protein [Parvularculaceae bacterium]